MASNGDNWGGATETGEKPKSKLSKTVSDKFAVSKDVASAGYEQTKVVASAGYEKTKVAAKKVKDGASVGVNWIKLKCNKSKLFQKK